jgi:hypothetical protein
MQEEIRLLKHRLRDEESTVIDLQAREALQKDQVCLFVFARKYCFWYRKRSSGVFIIFVFLFFLLIIIIHIIIIVIIVIIIIIIIHSFRT